MLLRVTSLLLALIMVFSLLLSCASQPTQNTPETTAASETSTEGETTYTRPDIEKCDYEGEKFMILYLDWGVYQSYFFAEEQIGEQMNDAIYNRTLAVEEYLGIDLDQKPTNGIFSAVQASVMAGTDDYQLVLTHCLMDLGNMMTSGLVMDWNTLPYISWNPEYWNESMNETLSVNGRLYYASSSYMITDPNAFLFNKQMIIDNNLSDPYQIVRDGKWTIDTLYNMVIAVSSDADGDGKFTVNNIYGLTAECDWMLISFMYGCDQFMLKREDDGHMVLNIYNDKMLTLTQKLYDLFYGGNHTYLWKFAADEDQTIRINSGRCLFTIVPLYDSQRYRQSEVEFGILPFPKFEEAQKNYISNDWGGLMCIPLNAENKDRIGKTCELLAYESLTTTVPAYYDILLNGKIARDNESVEMLNIIFSNIVYDMGMNFLVGFDSSVGNLFYMIPLMVGREKSTDLASYYQKNEKAANSAVERFFDKMQDVD